MQERMFVQMICPLVRVVKTQMRQKRPRYIHMAMYTTYFVACEVLIVMLLIWPWVIHRVPTG